MPKLQKHDCSPNEKLKRRIKRMNITDLDEHIEKTANKVLIKELYLMLREKD